MMYRHYEKFILASVFLLVFANVGLANTSFSVYQPFLAELFTDSTASLIVTMRTAISLLTMLFVDRYINFLNLRKAFTLATIFTACGFVFYGVAGNNTFLYLIGSACTGFGYGAGGQISMTITLNRWYKNHVSSAIGIAAVGSGAASIIMPYIATHIVTSISLNTSFFITAAITACIAIFVAIFLRNNPEDIGLAPHEDLSHNKRLPQTRTPQKPLPRFMRYLLLFAAFSMGSLGIGATSYLSILMTSSGFSSFFAGFLVSLMGFMLTISKFITGKVFDSMGAERGSEIFFIILSLALGSLSLMGLRISFLAIIGSVLFGIGISLASVGLSIWSLELTDPAHRLQTIKNFQICYAAGGVVFNALPGILKTLYGTYTISYVILLVLTIISGLIIRYAYTHLHNWSR
ncbi:MAG: MFS transporter [Actinomycetaceae bacterium]|nr:MFS transporter [Actinomycetaceae bacterium]